MRVTRRPNFERGYAVLREELANALVRAAKLIPEQLHDHIYAETTLDGGAQKQNSDSWAMKKLAEKGHTTPLRFDDVLSDPSNCTINGQSATKSVIDVPPSLRVIIRLPASRIAEVEKLEGMGYSVPWGITDHIRKSFRRFVMDGIAAWRQRMGST